MQAIRLLLQQVVVLLSSFLGMLGVSHAACQFPSVAKHHTTTSREMRSYEVHV